MKTSHKLKLATLALTLLTLLAACGSKKKLVEETTPQTAPVTTVTRSVALEKVWTNNAAQPPKFITSKVKFVAASGGKDISLTGNLKMKRDDVIRLQLMAFGLVEAARLEFTKDYVLIMDRINKQYIKAPYTDVDFLHRNGLSFYTLQALFWNELFQPNRTTLSKDDMARFDTSANKDGDAIIKFDADLFGYSWIASQSTGLIKQAKVVFKDQNSSKTGLTWNYDGFSQLKEGKRQFPNDMNIVLKTTKKEVELDLKLNSITHETDWEPYTEVSGKYREVTVEEILQRVMSL